MFIGSTLIGSTLIGSILSFLKPVVVIASAQTWVLGLVAASIISVFWVAQQQRAYKMELQVKMRLLKDYSRDLAAPKSLSEQLKALLERLLNGRICQKFLHWFLHSALFQKISNAHIFRIFSTQPDYREGVGDFLESLARSIRSGASLKTGIEETTAYFLSAGASSQTYLEVNPNLLADLNQLQLHLNSGMLLDQALKSWAQARQLPEVIKAVSALTFGSSYQLGGKRAEGIEILAEGLRAEISLEQEIHALSTQARVSGMVIALLPIVFLLIFSTADLGLVGFLFATPLGLLCLALGMGLNFLGAYWMKKITTKSMQD